MKANEDEFYRSGLALSSSKDNAMDEYLAKDARIEFPEDGVPFLIGSETVQWLRPGDMEIAYTEEGIVMHISLTLVGYERLRMALETEP